MKQFIVPRELMIPIGARATQRLKKCADSWVDSELALLRAELPPEFHAVPLDALGIEWRNIRKKGTPGYRVNGRGPAKGSRVKPKLAKKPKWYQDYIDGKNGSDWPIRKMKWVEFWVRCAVCNATKEKAVLDVHHRTYERLYHEEFTDCILLCRSCHDLFHEYEDDCEQPDLFKDDK